MNQILIIEDEYVIRDAVSQLLGRKGYQVSEAGSVEEAEAQYNLESFSLILSDVQLPGVPGTEVIARAPGVPVLIMTSYASVRSAVDSMKRGAVDYIAKPFDHDELLMLVERILKQERLERKSEVLKSEINREYPVDGMIGSCDAMQEVCRRIAKAAPTDSTVLILGDSGTGKELVARALHEKSLRKDAPIVTVNCAAIPETLIESELFGHEKGAFTGADTTRTGLVESAQGGTLFLDEIGELPVAAQARLLRVLQNGEIRRVGSELSRHVDVRLIAATHQDLKQRVQEGRFRSDLYFRLRVVELKLPALRERGDDIISLAQFLLEKAQKQLNRPPLHLTPEAIRAITHYEWPGNVRELENTMERAVILCEGDTITPDLLAIESGIERKSAADAGETGDLSLEEYFRRFVLEHQEALTETELAKRLGISRKALWERRQRFGIPRVKKGGH
ncbi:MAG: response regulator [Candidatus Sedimenticola endophacoides]|uniref:Response regulator n=1 Tax=Candidatus Sedimenticola endophacoides TaxID=2548426 RepID=A0A657PS99_9GAMM|nr:MAG: response regulator [Candidatus Sedimenticola endophacoides]OQX35141.1 MAG: response regulator [Candidatus Sedimenticola endophacoides]OQX42056.1 MAG: response regulator [Candidatus Sedimenticola endophacoides]OQX42934.1 MAG: response regulator [Candidatus Sedimenticola endophacoides]OQX46108.1 MAG: response regulator [Candidatus Sedimenticola endophacoides]